MPENRLLSYFWTCLPSVPALASAGGIVYKLLRQGEEAGVGGLGGILWNLLPMALEFGVPIVAPCGAYLMLVWGANPAKPPVMEPSRPEG